MGATVFISFCAFLLTILGVLLVLLNIYSYLFTLLLLDPSIGKGITRMPYDIRLTLHRRTHKAKFKENYVNCRSAFEQDIR